MININNIHVKQQSDEVIRVSNEVMQGKQCNEFATGLILSVVTQFDDSAGFTESERLAYITAIMLETAKRDVEAAHWFQTILESREP